MKFGILGTGSAGNCALLQTGATRVLIDAGFSPRKTSQLLAPMGTALEQIEAIFLTHEHGDHAALIAGLKRHPGIRVFANSATARVLQQRLDFSVNWQLFSTGDRFRFRDLEIESFTVPHDAQDPVGFVFTAGQDAAVRRRLVWLTDLGHCPGHIHERIRAVDVLVVEANHCPRLLQADARRPWSLKQRISGRHGHLSNEGTRALLDAVASPAWRHIFITHLSRDCNSPDAVQQAFAGAAYAHSPTCAFSVLAPGMSTPLFDYA